MTGNAVDVKRGTAEVWSYVSDQAYQVPNHSLTWSLFRDPQLHTSKTHEQFAQQNALSERDAQESLCLVNANGYQMTDGLDSSNDASFVLACRQLLNSLSCQDMYHSSSKAHGSLFKD